MRPLIGITADIDGNFLKLRRDYISAVVRAGGTPMVLAAVFDEIPRIAETIEGLLISGGDDLLPDYCNEAIEDIVDRAGMKFVEKDRTAFELALLSEMNKKKKPVLGICYGMQLISSMFGGTLYLDISSQKQGALDHKKSQHEVTVNSRFVESLGLMPQAFMVNSNHHQAIKSPGEGLQIFAEADDGIIEGIYHADYPFMAGVQWHPERSCDTLSLKMLELFVQRSTLNAGRCTRSTT